MKKKQLIILLIVIVLVAIVGLIIGKKKGMFGDTVKQKVVVEKVKSETIIEFITANGKIRPKTEVKISPDVSGEIIELFVKEGDQVKKGDKICIIKPEMYVSALNRALAALNSSKARLAQSQAEKMQRELSYKRSKKLYENGTIPVSEFEAAESAFKIAEAQVKSAQYSIKSAEASVNEAREQLTKTKIYAPVSGTISMLNVEKGERVVGTNMYQGTEMMRIADLDKMEVQVNVNENDIVKVAEGDTALIEVDAYLNRKFKGVVTEIAKSAKATVTTDQVTNFDVKILLLKNSYLDLAQKNKFPFLPGMSATVDIQTNTRVDVIAVPISAVTTRIKNGEKKQSDNKKKDKSVEQEKKEEVVFVFENGLAHKRKVA
ncbi:MAG: efflux transporter periplasmic adaptor subunit, partial [Draconibacterium sp.]